MVEEDQPERQPAKQVEPQIASGRKQGACTAGARTIEAWTIESIKPRACSNHRRTSVAAIWPS